MPLFFFYLFFLWPFKPFGKLGHIQLLFSNSCHLMPRLTFNFAFDLEITIPLSYGNGGDLAYISIAVFLAKKIFFSSKNLDFVTLTFPRLIVTQANDTSLELSWLRKKLVFFHSPV